MLVTDTAWVHVAGWQGCPGAGSDVASNASMGTWTNHAWVEDGLPGDRKQVGKGTTVAYRGLQGLAGDCKGRQGFGRVGRGPQGLAGTLKLAKGPKAWARDHQGADALRVISCRDHQGEQGPARVGQGSQGRAGMRAGGETLK